MTELIFQTRGNPAALYRIHIHHDEKDQRGVRFFNDCYVLMIVVQ